MIIPMWERKKHIPNHQQGSYKFGMIQFDVQPQEKKRKNTDIIVKGAITVKICADEASKWHLAIEDMPKKQAHNPGSPWGVISPNH